MPLPGMANLITWRPGGDPAKYLVNPGVIRGPGRHSAGGLRHARPYISNGSRIFAFPVGTEGFRRSGTATLSLHHYIGDNAVDGLTIHYEEARISLNGILPGITARDNMVDCINILRSRPLEKGLVLYVPGVFEREQYVLPESWDFDHTEDDRTHSISYTITFVRVGEGGKVADPRGTPPPPNPTVKTKPKGKPSRIFTVNQGTRTLRQIAQVVYGDLNQWQKLVDLNKGQLSSWQNSYLVRETPSHALPTYRWPLGTQFRY